MAPYSVPGVGQYGGYGTYPGVTVGATGTGIAPNKAVAPAPHNKPKKRKRKKQYSDEESEESEEEGNKQSWIH